MSKKLPSQQSMEDRLKLINLRIADKKKNGSTKLYCDFEELDADMISSLNAKGYYVTVKGVHNQNKMIEEIKLPEAKKDLDKFISWHSYIQYTIRW